MSSTALSEELSSNEPMSSHTTGMIAMVLVFFSLRADAALEPSMPATEAALVVVKSMPLYRSTDPG